MEIKEIKKLEGEEIELIEKNRKKLALIHIDDTWNKDVYLWNFKEKSWDLWYSSQEPLLKIHRELKNEINTPEQYIEEIKNAKDEKAI